MTTRILLADDHPLVRRGLRDVLEQEPDLRVVAEAGDGAEAVRLALDEEIDLANLDVARPRLTGLQAAEQLVKRRPATKVLLLSMYDSDQYLFAAVRLGAAGYLLKSVADEEIVSACRRILRGADFVAPAATTDRARREIERLGSDAAAAAAVLTPRETEVLKLVAEGLSTQEIADALVIAVKTVERHRANILEKLGVRDRVGLTRYAIRQGLVEP
jgi:DNA-binding NarL/FixJ family response regulator